jgi:hypothetical protein
MHTYTIEFCLFLCATGATGICSYVTESEQRRFHVLAKMADCNVAWSHRCLECVELVSLLEEARNELCSSQLIIRLLYKEVENITMEKTYKPSNSTFEYGTETIIPASNKWSNVASKRLHKEFKARKSNICQVTQPIENNNRYIILSNLSETICQQLLNCTAGYLT